MTNPYAVLRAVPGLPYAEILARYPTTFEARNNARTLRGHLGLDAYPIVRELVDDWKVGSRILFAHLRDYTSGD
jgi:hypothetical protein